MLCIIIIIITIVIIIIMSVINKREALAAVRYAAKLGLANTMDYPRSPSELQKVKNRSQNHHHRYRHCHLHGHGHVYGHVRFVILGCSPKVSTIAWNCLLR